MQTKFSNCTSIKDFGKIAWDDRLSGNGGVWSQLYDDVFSMKFDEQAYYSKYFSYMENNIDDLMNKSLENMPEYVSYKTQMISEFEEALKKVKAGHSASKLTGNEKTVFTNILINAMERMGI